MEYKSKTDIIILLVGKSASGKSAICRSLEKEGWNVLKSYTTRPIRQGDKNDIYTHTFVSKEEFDKLKDKCAYTEFDKYEYCATNEQIDKSDIYIIDPKGVAYFMQHYKGIKLPIIVYLDCSEENQRKRMLARNDSIESIERRIENDRKEFEKLNNYDYFLPELTYIESSVTMIKTIKQKEERNLFERRLP